jgi:hypothetical protein
MKKLMTVHHINMAKTNKSKEFPTNLIPKTERAVLVEERNSERRVAVDATGVTIKMI